LSREIARRTVRVRLVTDVERPWQRTGFRHSNLPAWALTHRSDLVWAALVIVRSWLDAGRPQAENTLGGFESWSHVMGGILDYAGIPGFLGTLDALYDHADDEISRLTPVVQAWYAERRDEPTPATELVKINSMLGDPLGLGEGNDRSLSTRLGCL